MYVANSLSGTVTVYSRNNTLRRPCLGFDPVYTISITGGVDDAQITDFKYMTEFSQFMLLGVSNPSAESDSIVGISSGTSTTIESPQILFQSSAYGQSPIFDAEDNFLAIADRVQSTITLTTTTYSGLNGWKLGPVLGQIQVGEPGTLGDLGESGLSSIYFYLFLPNYDES
jgi:hypothetical protein